MTAKEIARECLKDADKLEQEIIRLNAARIFLIEMAAILKGEKR